MGPTGAVAAVRLAVRAALADLRGRRPGALVLAACSGGADSLALSAALAFEAPRSGLRAGGVTVDHGLQEGSAQRAAEVAEALATLGLDPVELVPVSVAGPGGPEAAARRARREALAAAAARLGAVAVLLGHTRDDQAETVLLGLARGSGARSLSGMATRAGLFWRPLLSVSRATTRGACADLGLPVWDDPHNADPAFTRVRVRRAVLPVLEAQLGAAGGDTVASALARTAELLRDDADALDEWANRVRSSVTAADGSLDVTLLESEPAAVRRRVLRAAALSAGSPATDLTAEHVRQMDRLVTSWRGQRALSLPGPVSVSRRCGRLLLLRGDADEQGTSGGPAHVDEKDMGPDLERVLLSEQQIADRLAELAARIDREYDGRDLLLVGVLKGAVMVMADLARALHLPVDMEWMAVSSYGSGTKSSGVVRILKDLDRDISDRHVLVVEDVIDSGLTLSWLLANLRSRGPATVEVCALLRKPDAAQVDVPVRYVGFDIPNEFVVGYGLDYGERYRNLPFVGTLSPSVYSM